ncbi:dGTPase [Leifsonia sp. EB41]
MGEMRLFHNRMTHTQKVAQLSRRIAEYLNWDERNAEGLSTIVDGSVDVDAAEAAGLAHDLGHPPFGHIAETELNRLCTATDGYEGNAQSFRIVTKLSVRRYGFGLDLSPRTLDAILKYPWKSDHKNARRKNKWGAYLTESQEFARIRSPYGKSTDKSIEADIMDWADDITYAVHDLEDFYRAGFINLRRLKQDPVYRREFLAKALIDQPDDEWTIEGADQLFERLLFYVPPRLDEYAGTVTDRKNVNRFASEFINHYVSETRVTTAGRLDIPVDNQREVHLLKQLTWQFVVNDPALASLQRGQVSIIGALFTRLYEWASTERSRQRLPTRLSDLIRYAEREEQHHSDEARLQRCVADYIATLTEDQAIDLHSRLVGSVRGSIDNTWVAY